MPIVRHNDVPSEPFKGGAKYQTIVGDAEGSTPIRLGVQTSPPGYRTPVHTHPYLETITIIEGRGEAWIQGCDDVVVLQPGMTLVLPADVPHWFCATGDGPLVTLGVHASPDRIVNVQDN